MSIGTPLGSEDTLAEILQALDPDADLDPMVTPWKRGFVVAIRPALEQ
jgi:hypothetical protein